MLLVSKHCDFSLVTLFVIFIYSSFFCNYFFTQGTRKLRHKKKYAALPCPLLALNFWRLCIDEAQMVESDSTKLAEMALRITAKYRWCVTGTPLQKSIEGTGIYLHT